MAADDLILDIGPKTAALLAAQLREAGTIVWNGPVGVFEFDAFAKGTEAIARAIAESSAFSIAGGGDTLAAIAKYGIEDKVGYISTGGGAFLEVLEGKTLPAFEILSKRARHRLDRVARRVTGRTVAGNVVLLTEIAYSYRYTGDKPNEHAVRLPRHATKIVATLGPASSTPELHRADDPRTRSSVVRLNFSHGTAQDHIDRAAMVREAARRAGREVAIMADLQGPKIRVGKFAEGKVRLEAGRQVRARRRRAPSWATSTPSASTTRTCRAT